METERAGIVCERANVWTVGVWDINQMRKTLYFWGKFEKFDHFGRSRSVLDVSDFEKLWIVMDEDFCSDRKLKYKEDFGLIRKTELVNSAIYQ